jgi:hypothetical protein
MYKLFGLADTWEEGRGSKQTSLLAKFGSRLAGLDEEARRPGAVKPMTPTQRICSIRDARTSHGALWLAHSIQKPRRSFPLGHFLDG